MWRDFKEKSKRKEKRAIFLFLFLFFSKNKLESIHCTQWRGSREKKKKIRDKLKGWSFWSLRFFPHFFLKGAPIQLMGSIRLFWSLPIYLLGFFPKIWMWSNKFNHAFIWFCFFWGWTQLPFCITRFHITMQCKKQFIWLIFLMKFVW